jgi:hypothetical protein
MAATTEAVTAVAKVMVVMFKVVDAAPEVLIMAVRSWLGLQWSRLWWWWRL